MSHCIRGVRELHIGSIRRYPNCSSEGAMNDEVKTSAPASAVSTDFSSHIQATIRKSAESNRPFFIVMLKIENLEEFRKRRAVHVVNGFLREMYSAVRMAVHPSQYAGIYQDGV